MNNLSRSLPQKTLARLVQEASRRGLRIASQISGFERYQTQPSLYAEAVLGLPPWAGRNAPGQRELFDDIGESVRLQLAGGTLPDGTPPPQIFRVEAGHGVGKTFGAAILVNWFFDCFAPSITITTAPSKQQVINLLWKDVKKIRPASLPGRVLPSEPRMEKGPDHWAIGQTTNDSRGKGTERFQGLHDGFVFLILDEAEGVPDFVFDAVNAMMTGGRVVLCLMLANPRTRTSRFHKVGRKSGVMNYRLSVLDHPNVLDGVDTVPGATGRTWVDKCLGDWCETVDRHDEDNFTFGVPWHPGLIFQPNAEFLFRVMGIAPANTADNVLVPIGRYEAACQRPAPAGVLRDTDPSRARVGVDVAAFGNDYGTIYLNRDGSVRRLAQVWKLDQVEYALRLKEEALKLHADGVTDLHIRIDAGGGFAGGIIAILERDDELAILFERFRVVQVHFNGVPYDAASFADLATEMMAHAAESLKGLCVVDPPAELEADLTERIYDWVNKQGVFVKRLESKKQLRHANRLGRSPDDGDGFLLSVAPDILFAPTPDFAAILPVNRIRAVSRGN